MTLNEPSINGFMRRHPQINLGHVQQPQPRSPRNVILAVLFAVVVLELLYIWGALR